MKDLSMFSCIQRSCFLKDKKASTIGLLDIEFRLYKILSYHCKNDALSITHLSCLHLKAIVKDVEARGRLLEAYKMMLEFYGLELVDEKTGRVARNKQNWEDRFSFLNKYVVDNFLKLLRIF